jgi:hypothetical protein
MNRKLLVAIVLFVLAGAGLKAQVNLQNGLVGYYRLDGNANDASVNGFHGNVVGAVPAPDRFGVAGKAFSFAAGSKITANIPIIPVFAADRSVSVWAKWSALPFSNAAHVANWGSTGSGELFGVGVFKNNEWFTFGFDYPNGYDLSSGVVADTAWHNIIGVYENQVMKIYVDGVLKASNPKVLNTIFTHLFIGNRPDEPADSYFTGSVDEVRVYNRAINSAEVSAIYNGDLAVGNISKRDLDCYVYPNPAKDVLNIEHAKPGFVIAIYDMTGRLVRTHTLTSGNQVDISTLAGNMQYVVKVSYEGQVKTQQLLKL